MNVLYLDWACFCREDILELFASRGYHVTSFSHPNCLEGYDADMVAKLDSLLSTSAVEFDFCFSFNYFPMLAEACHKYNIKYISFVYDSPQVKLYSVTVCYPTNYIFLFDSQEVEYLRNGGLTNFYYMPLPVNPNKITRMLTKTYDTKRLSAEVSFVGALYHEKHNLLDRLTGLSDFTKGYLDGLMKAQSKVYGYSFLETSLPKEIVDDMQASAGYTPAPGNVETLEYVFANYMLCRKLTSMERIEFLNAIAAKYPLALFTHDASAPILNADNRGNASYEKELPYIFHNSKINLNISLRSIKSGIPLRCMDILGSGGFLLTNYQADFFLHFVPDEDFVYFDSKEDMLNKIDYYLSHEEQRAAIAASGYDKVTKYHNFDVIFDQILEIACKEA